MITKLSEPKLGTSVNHKRCSKCKVDKPFDHFGKDSKAPSGLQYYCKSCHRAKVTQVLEKQIEGPKKVCATCKQGKIYAEFAKDSRYSLGLKTECKGCAKAYQKDYQKSYRRGELRTKDIKTRTEKPCSRCKEVKPLGEYYKSKTCADGTGSTCKTCANKAQELRRATKNPQAKSYPRKRTRTSVVTPKGKEDTWDITQTKYHKTRLLLQGGIPKEVKEDGKTHATRLLTTLLDLNDRITQIIGELQFAITSNSL